MPRALVTLALCTAAGVVAFQDARAMGFGRARGGAVLGQPLDMAVPLSLEQGEAVPAECVSADVLSGERRIPASQVQARVETAAGESQLRVSTQVSIDEPVLQVTVSVGCSPKFTRSFTAFADPPGAATMPAEIAEQPVVAGPAEASTSRPKQPPVARPVNQSPVARASERPVRVAPKVAAVKPASAAPRLQLDPPAVVAPSPLLAEAQERAAAAQAAASAAEAAASAADRRMRTLEAEIVRLRAEAHAQRDAMLQLRSAAAQQELGSTLMPWLVVGVLVLASMAAWLWLRARRLERLVVHDKWMSQHSTRAAESAFDPAALPQVHTMEGAAFDRLSRHVSTGSAANDTAPAALQSLGPAPTPATARLHAERRAVTVEEQIDLEQQADFFIVLGQDDAAIDLLLTHLRGTGGTSPMPYLKLLEIYRRRDDADAYERIRERFNQRFNGVAPAWGSEAAPGRSLEDYPEVVQGLQRAWPSSLDTMAQLEALLFRKGVGAEHFDLPAYQELAFLYQLARDLHQHDHQGSQQPSSDVDVLLPIDTGGSGSLQRPVHAARAKVPEPSVEGLDIDLSESSR